MDSINFIIRAFSNMDYKIILILTFSCGITCETPVIQSPSGPIKGFTLTTATGKEVDAYFGVPYAKPPIGENRFQKPVPVEPWKEELQATKLPKACIHQLKDEIYGPIDHSEDCLYLTVVVPKSESKPLPVIVRIHGGGFVSGSSAQEWGNTTTLAAEENVIMVAMNYRLGIFGFLYMGTENAPGNAGLWDQNLALKWVKENIGSFGGDPDSITIIGESAGAASVHYHALSKHSQPYFNRAIMESGMAENPWAIQDKKKALEIALEVAEKTGCLRTDHAEAVRCLKELDFKILSNVSGIVKIDELLNFVFVPVVDGDFIFDHPRVLVEKGEYKKGDYLVGSAVSEGLVFAKFFLSKGTFQVPGITKDDIPIFATYLSPNNDKLIKNVIEYLYTNWTNPDNIKNLWDSADKIFGDYYFTSHINYFSDSAMKSGNSTIFRHVFAQPVPDMFGLADENADHASQVSFIYGSIFSTAAATLTSEQVALSRKMMRRTANFARTGDPNKSPDGSEPQFNWPKYTLDNKEYLLVKAKEDTVGYGYRDDYCAFWRELLPKLQQERESCSA